MAIKANVCVVQICVHDMDAAIAFYELLGFEAGGRELYPQYVELDHVDVDRFTLLLKLVPIRVPDYYPTGTQTIINIEVENVDQILDKLRQENVFLIDETTHPFPVGRYAAISDPSGNVIELVEWQEGSEEKERKKSLVQV